MQNSPQQRRAARTERHRRPGRLLAGAGALVVAALVLVPWLVGRLVAWPPAPAVAAFVALLPALYVWFRAVQRTTARTAVVLALVHAALAAGLIWLWRAP